MFHFSLGKYYDDFNSFLKSFTFVLLFSLWVIYFLDVNKFNTIYEIFMFLISYFILICIVGFMLIVVIIDSVRIVFMEKGLLVN